MITTVLSTIFYIFVALVLLSVIVVAHELGHFIAGRSLGIGVEEFAVGFGPKIFGFKRKGIQYSLRAVPMGGFCKFVGEDAEDDQPNAMNNQPVWKRFITILSGPVMNFVFALLAAIVLLTFIGRPESLPMAQTVEADSPAAIAGMQDGDIVTEINGESIEYNYVGAARMLKLVQGANSERPLAITVDREGEAVSFEIVPALKEDGNYRIGISMGSYMHKASFGASIRESFPYIKNITVSMVDSLKNLIFKGEGLEDTAGPVGIIVLITDVARNNAYQLLTLMIIISLNLGIINLLPLPALDGGRLVFLIIEGIRRKPVKPEFEGWVHAAGFLLLIGLIVVITYRDVLRLVTGG